MVQWFQKLKNAGVEDQFSERKKRAIRTSNLLTLNGINICIPFIWVFWVNNEPRMAIVVSICAFLYLSGYLITAAHWPNLGRSVTLISGCLTIMDIALYYGGNSHAQFLLLCMAAVPLMMIEWESLPLLIFLQLVPVTMVIVCEATQYSLYSHMAHPQSLRVIQTLSLFIGFSQTIFGMYLFARQSVFFEDETIRYVKALDVEHRKQIQIQKMSALGEMSAGVAHEINNPLAIISLKCTNLTKLVETGGDRQVLLSGLQNILDTSGRIAKIVKGLKAFSRNAENDPVIDVELQSIVHDALSLSEERMKLAGIDLRVEVNPELKVRCRPTQVAQVLINLFNNSYDVVAKKPGAWLEIKAKPAGGDVEMTVTDSGGGIAPELAEKIMEPFFTTKELGKGTGLGLSISKGLMESMGGDLLYNPDSPNTQFRVLMKAPA